MLIFRPGISLTKQKESLLRDRDRLTCELEKITKRLQKQKEQINNLEDKRSEYEEKCRELYRLLDVINTLNYLLRHILTRFLFFFSFFCRKHLQKLSKKNDSWISYV